MRIEFYQHLFDNQDICSNENCSDILYQQLSDIFSNPNHGHFGQWLNTLEQLSPLRTDYLKSDQAVIEIGKPQDIYDINHQQIEPALKSLLPWRKGPFKYFGTEIDSEWRCDQKWQRVMQSLATLENKNILDVGCGNGYYMLRMLGAGAKSVIGVDPTLIFCAQFYALTQNLTIQLPAYLLPVSFEQLPNAINHFDYVFSMGVLYHRRYPLEHLKRLYSHLNDTGYLILETLIIDSPDIKQLIPAQRYAGMRNVWSVPSPSQLKAWLTQCGYKNIRLHNIQATSFDEQRATPWTKNYSLENFLNTADSSKTIEGYPAPTRAILSAQKL